MYATTVAVDLAKSVFQLAVADEHWRVVETQRLTRTQFERWFLNREYSSGSSRYLGRISKKGDRYLRMLLTHGARSVLRAAKVADNAGREVCGVRRWALDVQARSNHNKAACALANKLARICYATLRDRQPFGEPTVRLGKKINRESFVMPA